MSNPLTKNVKPKEQKQNKNKHNKPTLTNREEQEDNTTYSTSTSTSSSSNINKNNINDTTDKFSAAVPQKNMNTGTNEHDEDDNQSLNTSTKDRESIYEEEENQQYDDDDDEMNDKEKDLDQSTTVSKLLQSRPVMFSGNQKDFLLYKRHLLILLNGCNLVEELKPKDERSKRYRSNKTTRTRAITMINSTLPQKTADSFLEQFEVNDAYNLDIDPVEYWKTICSRYEKNTELNKQLVQQELAEEKMKHDEPIDDYNGRLIVHFQRLRSFGDDMKEETKKFHLLKGLPAEYKPYTQAMSLSIKSMTYEDVVTHLTNFQENLRAEQKKMNTNEAQLVSNIRNKNQDQAAFVRSFGNTSSRGRGRFPNFRGRGLGRTRGTFNHQRVRIPYQNRFTNFRPKEVFNYSGRGRGSFRGRNNNNYNKYKNNGARNFINRRPAVNNYKNNYGNGMNNNDNHNDNNNNEENKNQSHDQDQRQILACWKCGKPGHKSIDCRN